ncbi:hypothetical protein PIROE2DRAFT_17014 [Piromyces sp. E2]|nr:hypothetical protein PIROE2DRAFT_17014 [Piromyces sp. E2]|eukprot:OUM57862.1 hypothetical protein PIROE2DRAFT_17014 [Piromyces sp. E2]
MINPDKCDYEDKVTLKPGPCYLMNNGKEIVKISEKVYPAVRYFDVDKSSNRALTEFGWCSSSNIKNIDANWINYINKNLKLNEINIPGTLGSGTYNFGQTQDLDIIEQLNSGIRYLDVRLATNNNELNKLYLFHGKLPFISTTPSLNTKGEETIIIHITEERIVSKTKNLSQLNADYTILNKDYGSNFYTGDTLVTSSDPYNYNNTANNEKIFSYIIKIDVSEMGECRNYPKDGCGPLRNCSFRNFTFSYNTL